MKLHLETKLFNQAIQFTADIMNIPAIYVEKDYWITYALYTIFHSHIAQEVVFKGGTSLSKCYQLIDRFSEDIDLVILKNENDNANQLKRKLKAISHIVGEVLPEITVEGLTNKKGTNRKTVHTYDKFFQGDYGQVRRNLVIEATCLGYFEPYTEKEICSFVGKMMMDNQQIDIAKNYDLLPFNVQVLEPTRTLCEKIMSLIRFSYSEDPVTSLKNKIRHIYDLNQLLLEEEFLNFLYSHYFDDMLKTVAKEDVKSFKNNNQWLKYHPVKALIFNDPTNVWKYLQPVYKKEFSLLVYGKT
ncbi:nucleotidyl transferase AbiEii/AbiGii toxin family protein [Phocoenobacter skyensis]|uniref:Nucleotidyl transferase AbiEii toxin, Type IV TA system n=1 Tax=Phocoenobacter skyensis TaxID=97481 RepID=A0A1H7Y8A1_9PAST|nr:nucleotidyl transferase AbiEii/AbiGii toxin family protein [Pasteurella skyensis]MDP8078807.1 nucleotidyl transferase AbiEii/AbiGii toxin family protein [Pasteurella skyensis]MDP8085867.1 nucleotidyl transferase AbiEii/AbiGii toxin family protein [Pasteurella skyensis]MDP8186018.1 nucleotidyl transferase AbiEii/AbiGii toxin family protein [Pasteurella skyensis]SEM42175.1 Nucleotidyl transferase AbiEii toxin, Type IV TA system [Pasteurella skyensis]